MKLYVNYIEAKVLLDALILMKCTTYNTDVEEKCDKLIARIEKCEELQHPDCDRKEKQQ